MIRAFLFFIFLGSVLKAQDKGLVARYSFNNGDARDDLGKNNAKAYGILWTDDRFGNAHSACYIQGNFDSFLNLGISNTLKPKKGTISLWIKIDQPIYKGQGAENNPIIFARAPAEKDEFNDGYIINYEYNLRKLTCNTSVSETQSIHVFPAETAYLRTWYHVAMTYDDSFLCLYINGVLEGKVIKHFESKFDERDSVTVGIHYGARNRRCFHGTVDDIYIYNRVLSPYEISVLYNEPNPNRTSVVVKRILFVLAGLGALIVIVIIVRWRIRRVLMAEKEKNQLKNNWYEQENKVLAAQMDPHFIFNSLNTIQQFIITNENDKAQLYLVKFSRLLRMILESNIKDTITLMEEKKIIIQYLEIESLRFNNVFKYSILTEEGLDQNAISIPRFLIQPFVENAIWHGLLPKDGDKLLNISFSIINEKILSCVIEDNGVGRKNRQDSYLKVKRDRSLAINFIKQRLQLMGKIYKQDYDLFIYDKTDDHGESMGTKVTINLPILKNK